MSAREFGSQLVRALAGTALHASDDLARLHRRIAEPSGRAERYRLAWTSARQRAANHLAALIDADEERDGLRAEVVRLGRGSLLDARLVVTQRDDARRALERVATERDEARAEVVRLGKELHRLTHPTGGNLHFEASGIAWIGPEPDEVSAATDRLRAALSEERIEPEPRSS